MAAPRAAPGDGSSIALGRSERRGDALDRGECFRRALAGVIAGRDRDAQPFDPSREERQRRLGRLRRAGRVRRIGPLHRVIGEREVFGRSRERTADIEARREQPHAGAAQAADGRPEAEDAAERRRHPDRAVGVGAERERDQARGDRRRRAARRSARDPRRIVRIAGRAIMRVLGREAERVLIHVEGADEDCAGRGQPPHERRILGRRRPVAVDVRAGDGGQASDVVEVLDRERDAGQRAGVAPGADGGVDRRRRRKRPLFRDRGEGVDRRRSAPRSRPASPRPPRLRCAGASAPPKRVRGRFASSSRRSVVGNEHRRGDRLLRQRRSP